MGHRVWVGRGGLPGGGDTCTECEAGGGGGGGGGGMCVLVLEGLDKQNPLPPPHINTLLGPCGGNSAVNKAAKVPEVRLASNRRRGWRGGQRPSSPGDGAPEPEPGKA